MPNTKRRLLRCFGFVGLLVLICFCAYLFPKEKRSKKEDSSSSTFGVKVNAVIVNVSVTDKSGNPVTDLSARDFKLYDDGTPQTIQTFAQESSDHTDLETAQAPSSSTKVSAKRNTPAPKQNAESPPRFISVIMDDLTMESPGRPGSFLDYSLMAAAVKKFVTKDLSPTDQVAILSGSRNVQFPFTNDKERLIAELDAVPKKLNSISAIRDAGTDYNAWKIANDMMGWGAITDNSAKDDSTVAAAHRQYADIQSRTRNLLYTIRMNLRVLAHMEGPKMVVLLSDGFITEPGKRTGAAEAHELQELVDMALRSGITLNTISTRWITSEGIFTTEEFPETPWSMFAPYQPSMPKEDTEYERRNAQEQKQEETRKGQALNVIADQEGDRMMQEKPMAQMASETGGDFFPRSNDMYSELRTTAHHRHSYYVMTYTMPPHKPDGAYHHIKLEVIRPGLKVSFRKGYYSPSEELTFENSNREDLMAALHGPGNMNAIPITLSYSSSREDDSTYSVSFVTNVNVRKLRFAQEDNRRRNQISLVLAAFDETDHFINGLEKSIDFQLLESSYTDLRQHGLTSRVELKLPPGRFTIKAVVRENSQGKMGSIIETVEIP